MRRRERLFARHLRSASRVRRYGVTLRTRQAFSLGVSSASEIEFPFGFPAQAGCYDVDLHVRSPLTGASCFEMTGFLAAFGAATSHRRGRFA